MFERLEEIREALLTGVYSDEQVNALLSHVQALRDENKKLREAIATSPETYRYVEEDDTWNGQEFCWFCEGEMANQQVYHMPDCAWLLTRAGREG